MESTDFNYIFSKGDLIMKEAMNNFENATKEMLELCAAEFGKAMIDGDMSETEITALQKALKLTNAAMEVVKAQSDMLIELNDKLDKLIERKES
jgi:hypothetical protein